MSPLSLEADLEPAAWLPPLLTRWTGPDWPPRVSSLVPPVFEAYARLRVADDIFAPSGPPDHEVRINLAALLEHLSRKPPRCWFALWDGYAPHPLRPPPTFETCARRYFLFSGVLSDLVWRPQPLPDLWWPEDRAWFLGGDTDQPFVFLGGRRRMVKRVVEEFSGRADFVRAEDPIDRDGRPEFRPPAPGPSG